MDSSVSRKDPKLVSAHVPSRFKRAVPDLLPLVCVETKTKSDRFGSVLILMTVLCSKFYYGVYSICFEFIYWNLKYVGCQIWSWYSYWCVSAIVRGLPFKSGACVVSWPSSTESASWVHHRLSWPSSTESASWTVLCEPPAGWKDGILPDVSLWKWL